MDYYTTTLLILVLTVIRVKGKPTVAFEPQHVPMYIDDMILKKDVSVTCKDKEFINLSGLGLQRIPDKFVGSSTIQAIDFDDNEITMIPPDAFNETPNLKCLNLARNKIPIGQMQINHNNLNTLIIDYQTVSETNDLVSGDEDELKMHLPNLETLSWKNINYEFFTKFSSLFLKLTTIYLSNSKLQYMSQNISTYLTNLRNIHLEHNLIKDLYIDCGNIEAIYLDGNPLQTLQFNSIPCNLQILSLSNCLLENALSLNLQSLRVLDLSRNRIGYISDVAFRYTPFLEKLNLSNNKLKSFPQLQHLNSLTVLSLNYNSINDMSHTLTLKSLKVLSLRGNFISRIDKYTFSALINLEYLDLSQNNLYYLPENWSQSLKILNLQMNHFNSVDNMMLNSLVHLEELYIKNSGVTSISLETLQYMPKCTIHVI